MALAFIAAEEITVSTAVIGPSSVTTPVITNKVVMAVFQHKDGGIINHLTGIDNTEGVPGAGGGAGEIEEFIGNKWEYWGYNNINNVGMIKQTGEGDATITVQYYGQGGG